MVIGESAAFYHLVVCELGVGIWDWSFVLVRRGMCHGGAGGG